MKCPACGFENEADVRFCGNCGMKLPEEAVQGLGRKLFCPNCGQENPPGARFCQNCGVDMSGFAAPPPQVPQAAPMLAHNPKKGMPGWVWVLITTMMVVILAEAFLFFTKKTSPNEVVPKSSSTEVQSTSDDPSKLLASEACKPGETLLYAEDFQDGTANEWSEVTENAPGLSIVPALDDQENLVLQIQNPGTNAEQFRVATQLSGSPFSNAVLRIRFYISVPLPAGNNDWFSFNWLYAIQPFELEGQQVYDSRYQLPIGFNYFGMRRLQQPLTNEGVDQTTNPSFGKWHSLEIATYQPRTEVWLDGKRVMDYEDPQPLPEGTFGLEAWLEHTDVQLLFDNIVICELNASYQP